MEKRNAPNWFQMCFILEEEQKVQCIEEALQRALAAQRNQVPQLALKNPQLAPTNPQQK